MVWPYSIGRRLALRFIAVREATWLSDRIWRFDDEVRYHDGRVQRRRTYCEFVTEDHVRLTVADLPDGADVHARRWLPHRPVADVPAARTAAAAHPLPRRLPDRTGRHVRERDEACTPVFGLPVAHTRFYVRPDRSRER